MNLAECLRSRAHERRHSQRRICQPALTSATHEIHEAFSDPISRARTEVAARDRNGAYNTSALTTDVTPEQVAPERAGKVAQFALCQRTITEKRSDNGQAFP
jgi:hypothetical protein